MLKTVDLKNGWIDYGDALKVSQDFHDAHPAAQVRKGDILVASTGYVSMGKVDVYGRDEPAVVDGHVGIVRVNSRYNPQFTAAFLRSHFGQLQFEKWFTGSSGQIELQPHDLGNFLVPTFESISLNEQRRVAALVMRRLKRAHALELRAEAKWREARDLFLTMILGNELQASSADLRF